MVDVGLGNQVYVAWFSRDERHIDDSERGRYKVWVSSYESNAPSQTPVSRPMPVPIEASIESERATLVPTRAPGHSDLADTSGLPPGLYTDSDDIGRLLLALAPVGLVLLPIVVLRLAKFKLRG